MENIIWPLEMTHGEPGRYDNEKAKQWPEVVQLAALSFIKTVLDPEKMNALNRFPPARLPIPAKRKNIDMVSPGG